MSSTSTPSDCSTSPQRPTDVVDDIEVHLPSAREFDKAALIPGMYLAWCARLNLLSHDFAKAQAQELLRLHYNDGSCIELLVSGCGGTLKYCHLNEQGRKFTQRYYSQYLSDWARVFGEDIYEVEDSWDNYHKIAGVLTKALLGEDSTEKPTGKPWWKFWGKSGER